jgi:hypothetical protein
MIVSPFWQCGLRSNAGVQATGRFRRREFRAKPQGNIQELQAAVGFD